MGSRLKQVRVAGMAFLLILAACAMLLPGSRHAGWSASASASGSPLFPASARSASGRSFSGSLFSDLPATSAKSDARSLLSHLPLIFEPNQGQASSGVKFVARGAGYSLYLDPTSAVLATRGSHSTKDQPVVEAIRMTLVGANPAAAVAGSDPLPGKSNYFIGNDPKKWHAGIPQFGGVHYENVYPGIDLVFYGSQGHLEYDFKVAPGANPSQAELQFDGASKLELSGGDLILKGSNVRLQAPHLYQSAAGERQAVEGHFVLRSENRVGFEIGAYDRSRELVIDPTIVYSTYFGGSGAEISPSIAVNGNGLIYLAASTTSTDLPVTGNAYQATLKGAQNIFILELDPTAGAGGVAYLTYLGGSGTDTLAGSPSGASAGLAVDTGGNVFVAGSTTSADFPSVNGYHGPAAAAGVNHAFVSEISQITSATPALSYSTVLAGNGTDLASAMAIDGKGDVFVTGTTTSSDAPSITDVFPASFLPAPFQTVPQAAIQFFMTEVNTKNIGVASVPYSTYFGGATGTIAIGGGIAVDTTGNVYFSGTTNFFNSGEGTNGTGGLTSGDFPITNAYQPCLDTVPPTSLTYPLTCTAPASPAPTDAFLAKMNPANAQTGAAQLLYSTYLGGTSDDSSTGLTIDTGASNVYITGTTDSSDFLIPTGIGAFQECLDNPVNPVPPATCTTGLTDTDAYVAKFSNPTEATGSLTNQVTLSYFSYLGGTGNDSGLAIAVDTAGGALLTGATSSTDFPASIGAIQTHLGTGATQNAFFAHINTTTASTTNTVASYATYFGGNGSDRGTSIAVDPSLNTYFAGDTTSTNLQTQGPYRATLDGPSDAFAVKLQPVSNLCIKCVLPVLSPSSGVVSAGTAITVTYTLTNQGPDLATNITISGNVTGGATFTSATAGSGTCSAASGANAVCTIPALQAGSTSSIVFSVTPSKAGSYSAIATVTFSGSTTTGDTATASFTATDYSIAISPPSATVSAGNTATYFVSVNPSQTFGANVTLSCGALPTGASCGFNPSSLTFNGPGSQSSTLRLTTTERPVTTISSLKRRGPVYALWLMVPGMTLLGLGKSKRRRRHLLGLLGMLTLLGLVMLLPACSSTRQQPVVSGTPAGSYTLTLTATSGTFTQTAGFNLTVQ